MSLVGRTNDRFQSSLGGMPRSSLEINLSFPVSFRSRCVFRSRSTGAYVSRETRRQRIVAAPIAIARTQKIQRHPLASLRKPPATGPMTGPRSAGENCQRAPGISVGPQTHGQLPKYPWIAKISKRLNYDHKNLSQRRLCIRSRTLTQIDIAAPLFCERQRVGLAYVYDIRKRGCASRVLQQSVSHLPLAPSYLQSYRLRG